MDALKEVVFHLTGFGKFNGVPDNPTSLLMKSLPVYLSQQKQQLGLILRVASYTVLETSADGASDQLRVIQNSGSNASHEGITVYVHFGVSASSTCFNIEECAYNEATFRVPDEKGQTPNAIPIIPQNGSLTHCYKSTLPVQWIYETLKTAGWGDCVEYSQDPGRFVCNYVYYKSLAFCEKSADKRCIFIHCPPLDVVGAEDQLCFVKDSLIVIADSLVKGIQRTPQLVPAPSISDRDATVMALMTMGFDIDAINSIMANTGSVDLDINYAALVSINEQQNSGDWVVSPLPPLIPRSNSSLNSPFGKMNTPNHLTDKNLQRNSPNGSMFGGQVSVNSGNGPHKVLVPSLSQKNLVNPPIAVAQSYPRMPHNLPQAIPLPPSYDNMSVINVATLPMAFIQQHHQQTSGSCIADDDEYADECVEGSLPGRPLAQASKILLVVRQDLNLTSIEVTQQCIQASVRASRAVKAYDSMSVRQWIRDGDQVVIAAANGENDLNNVVEHATELCLPVLTLLAHDSEDMPIAIAAIGPSPSGVLQEVSAGLALFS